MKCKGEAFNKNFDKLRNDKPFIDGLKTTDTSMLNDLRTNGSKLPCINFLDDTPKTCENIKCSIARANMAALSIELSSRSELDYMLNYTTK